MRRNILFVAIAVAALGCATDSLAKERKSKAGHQFKGTVEVQYRTNKNLSIAPSSGDRFDFASLSEFGIEDEDGVEGDEDDEDDEDEDEDDFDDYFDDLVDVDPDEDEIDVDDAIDEDGDGIDDLLDPDPENLVGKQNRFTTKVAFNHKYTFKNESVAWTNAVRFANDTHNQRDDLDKFNYAVTTGLEFASKGNPHKFRPSVSWVSLEKDNRNFVSTFVVSLAYSYEVSKRLSLGATYNYQDKDLAKPTAPDATVDTVSLTASFKATDDDIFKLKFAPKVEDSSQVTRNTDASGFEIAYTRKLPWDMTAGLGYRFDTVEYKNLQPRTRTDDNRTWTLQVTRDFGKKFSVEAGFESRERESNIPGKNAENDSFFIGASYKF